jgi:hypothetical protein
MSRLAQMLCVSLILVASCSHRSSQPSLPARSSEPSSYIDLEPGWRISVITPLTRSGVFTPQRRNSGEVKDSDGGLTMTLQADSDLIGYERSYYQVEALRRRNHRGGIRVKFAEAQNVIDGKLTPSSKPRVPLFVLPDKTRYVRLLYLVRSSDSDHNMAVLAASTPEHLQALTGKVQHSPLQACTLDQTHICVWVPAGIAVRPEKHLAASDNWVPAR